MMKKILSFLLFAFVLTSCTGGENAPINPDTVVIDDTTIVEEIIVEQAASDTDEAMKEFENMLIDLIESEG